MHGDVALVVLAAGILTANWAVIGILHTKWVVKAFIAMGLLEFWEFLNGEMMDEDGEEIETPGRELATVFVVTLYVAAWLSGDMAKLGVLVAIGAGAAAREKVKQWLFWRECMRSAKEDDHY